jgi:hypothetical protein
MEVLVMKPTVVTLCAVLVLSLVAIQVHAHHPFSAEFDPDKSVTLTGTVTKFDWANPHSTLSIDVKGENGQVTNWTFEMGAPKKLRDFGWKKDSVKAGDQVTVNAWRARDQNNRGSANMITLSNGTKLVGGSSFFDARRDTKPVSN